MKPISPLADKKYFCRVAENFLSAVECAALIARIGATASANSDYPPSYRNNQRKVFHDPALAVELAARMQTMFGAELVMPEAEFVGINPRWRGCRYSAGEGFNIHQDGVFHPRADNASNEILSRLTFMLYLDGRDNFTGGDTIFFADGPGTAGAQIEIGRYRPQLGALIVFSHTLWHAGEVVSAGSKAILRSDLLYRDRVAKPADAHNGYVFCVAKLDAQTHASGGRDGDIRLWQADCNTATLHVAEQSIVKIAALGEDHLVAISRDRSISIWHWRSQILVARKQACFAATPLAVLALDSKNFLVSDATGSVSLCSFQGRQLRLRQQSKLHLGWAWAMCALPSGEFASVGEDGAVVIFAANFQIITRLDLTAPQRAIVSAEDGTLYCGDANGQIYQLRIGLGTLTETQRWCAHTAAVRCLQLDSGGQLWSGAEDNQLLVWRVSAKAMPSVIAQHALAGFVCDVLVTENKAWVASYAGHLGIEIADKIEHFGCQDKPHEF